MKHKERFVWGGRAAKQRGSHGALKNISAEIRIGRARDIISNMAVDSNNQIEPPAFKHQWIILE